jgi:flagellar hook-length control protein FliK
MTSPVSILPVSTRLEPTAAVVDNSDADDAANPFTELLQGIISHPEQQGEQTLALFPGISLTTDIVEEGNGLPENGQAIASGQFINPFMALTGTDTEFEQASMTLPLDSDLLSGKAKSALPTQLAAVLNQLADKPASFTRAEQLPLNFPGANQEAAGLATMASAKPEQLIASMGARLAGMVEQATSPTDSLTSPSNSNTHLINSVLATSGTMPSATARADSMVAPLNVAPQNPAWPQAVGERVQWMVNQQLQKAEIRLDPPELGSLEVRVVIQKEHAQVTFAAPNAQVRDALEAAIPRLREMLGEQGLDLANVDIGQHSFAEQREQNASESFVENGNTDASATDISANETEEETNTRVTVTNSLLDTYA